MTQRKDFKRPPEVLDRHPTGLSAAAATFVVVLLPEVGIEVSAQLSAAIVGLVAALVSALTPR